MEIDLLHWSGLDYLLNPHKRLYWPYLLSALLLGLVYIKLSGQNFSEVFNRRIWWHQSARLDYQYFVLSSAIKLSLIYPLVFSSADVAIYLVRQFESMFGHIDNLTTVSTATLIAYAFCLFLFGDFTRYWLHRFMHRLPLLWAFHKVHHSAEVLTPLTFYRVHPLENLLFGLRYAISSGLVTGIFLFYFGAGLSLVEFIGVNLFVACSHWFGDNLRHSPIPFNYPEMLQHWLISPAQHQLHHSIDGNRFNFGGVLSIWDHLFGSLKIARPEDHYRFGITEQTTYSRVWHLLFKPFAGMKAGLLPVAVLIVLTPIEVRADQAQLTELGRVLFFDKNLSFNRRQACASCHNPQAAFIDSRPNRTGSAVSLGDDQTSLGDRNAPMIGYASASPEFYFDSEKKQYIGGQFWDGRAPGLFEQARGPFLNPIEMAMPDVKSLVSRLKESEYYRSRFRELFDVNISTETDAAFDAAARSIASFEQSDFFSPFDSKYDRFLRGEYELSDEEDLGMSIFFSTTNSNCSSCHQLKVMDDEQEPFSNFEFHNIGTPVNTAVRRANGLGEGHKDLGLFHNPLVKDRKQVGKFKVPGLRNIAISGPYMHNGVFRELRTVIEFYDQYNNPRRKLNPETGQPWQLAEVDSTINHDLLKAKKLSDRKIDALIEFLKTLTDRRYEHLINPG